MNFAIIVTLITNTMALAIGGALAYHYWNPWYLAATALLVRNPLRSWEKGMIVVERKGGCAGCGDKHLPDKNETTNQSNKSR